MTPRVPPSRDGSNGRCKIIARLRMPMSAKATPPAIHNRRKTTGRTRSTSMR
jgi:hypothetical protein